MILSHGTAAPVGAIPGSQKNTGLKQFSIHVEIVDLDEP